jgi:hypothetical protein
MRRMCAVVLLAMLTLVSAAPITCAGWEASPSDRMACCKRAAHGHSVDPAMADSCCAGQEQTHQSASTVNASAAASRWLAPAVIFTVFQFVAVDVQASFASRLPRASRFHDPPGSSASPLRI